MLLPLSLSMHKGEAIDNAGGSGGAYSLAKNEKQHVFCLQTRILSEHPHEHAACGGVILTGFSLMDAPSRVSQTKMTTEGGEAGGNRVRTAASRIGGRR